MPLLEAVSCGEDLVAGDPDRVDQALELLDRHFEAFRDVAPYATETGHPVPMDTRGWSQVIVSVLTGTKGLERKKGADLADGSDVKAANTWEAIDTPRFNGVIKAGTKAEAAGTMASLDIMPHLYFVLWDTTSRGTFRCRIWVVRPVADVAFRTMCEEWYARRISGAITSNNFQLHPPRGLDSNVIRNSCGNLTYPLLFCAERDRDSSYRLVTFDPRVLSAGRCSPA
jgi:hypothetical protein